MKRKILLSMLLCACLFLAGVADAAPAAWPESGKVIRIIIPWATGGSGDMAARLLSANLEKELGVSVEIVNSPGAGTQIGLTEFMAARPDGYTIGQVSLPTAFSIYMDPSRSATFTGNDMIPVGMQIEDPGVAAVRSDSPYSTLKELIDGAKANPGKINVSNNSFLGLTHLQILSLQKMGGAAFSIVQFDGGAPSVTALLGGHVDVLFGTVADAVPSVKNGDMKVLGVSSSKRSDLLPDVPTFDEQGFPIFWSASRLYAVSAKTPPEIVEILRNAFDKAMDDQEMITRLAASGSQYRYLNGAETEKYWKDAETAAAPLIADELESTK